MSKKTEAKQRARYTLEFKLEAVRLVKGGQELSVTARVLGVGNVFDRTYHDSVGSTLADLSVVPGAPRSITASMRLAF